MALNSFGGLTFVGKFAEARSPKPVSSQRTIFETLVLSKLQTDKFIHFVSRFLVAGFAHVFGCLWPIKRRRMRTGCRTVLRRAFQQRC